MIERFNGRIAEVLATTRFDSAEHLADTIKRYVKVYNQHIPQNALGHSPPLQAMKNWSQKQTQLFKKCAYNLAGLDSRPVSPCAYTAGIKPAGCPALSGVVQGRLLWALPTVGDGVRKPSGRRWSQPGGPSRPGTTDILSAPGTGYQLGLVFSFPSATWEPDTGNEAVATPS